MSTMKLRTFAVDVDEVCAALIPEWLRRYNLKWDDTLQAEDIDRWNLSECVRPECGDQVYDILSEPDLYDYVLPVPGALKAVVAMRDAGHRVVFVTSCLRGSVDCKVEWLIRWGFLPDNRTQPDFYAASDKSLIRADALIDDHVENVASFPGVRVLINQPHNRKVHWPGMRADTLREAYAIAWSRIVQNETGVRADTKGDS